MSRNFAQPITSRIPLLMPAARTSLRLLAWLGSTAGTSFCCGALASLYSVVFCHQMFARLGSGLMTSAATAAALAIGLLIGAVGSRLGRSRAASAIVALVPAIWILLSGWFADRMGSVYGSFELSALAAPKAQFAAALGTALLLVGVPAACGARLALGNRTLDGAWGCFGAGVGCLITAYGLGPWFGLQWTGGLAAVVTVAWVAQAAFRRSSIRDLLADERLTVATAKTPGALTFLAIVFGSVAAGLTAGSLARLIQQLMPGTEAIEWTACAGFLLGAAASWRFVHAERIEWRLPRVALVVLAAALTCALPVVLFRSLTDLFLAATASLSNVALLFFVRGLAVAVVLSAAGALWAAIVSWGTVSEPAARESASDRHPRFLAICGPALLAGLIGARWLILLGVPLPLLVAVGALLPATVASVAVFRAVAARGKLLAGAGWIAAATLLAVGALGHTYEPSRSARLLFSTNVFMAWRNAEESRLLPFLDDSRLLAQREGECGTYTVWKQRGMQLSLRESGVPCGTFCPRPEIGPQFSGEIVPSVLPLVLHEAPRHVLILGLGSGSGLASCLEFPIEDVTCVEADRALIDVLESTVWSAAEPNPRLDNRARVLCVEPSLAVQSKGGSYDVVYADLGQSGVSQGTSHYTREFYTAAARQLTKDGIFAQRFQEVDFGPWPLQSVLATLQSVFPHVAALEVAPGELALVATRSEKGLARPNLLERFQTPQARRTLAHLGWDWSIALNLAAYAGDDCHALTRGAAVNTATNGLFAFRLPQETMRWAPKNEELAVVLAPHAGRIAQWPNVDGNDPGLLRRLSDVMREHDMMTSYTDQPWAYRKLLREELTKHPHTTIENGDAGFERRLDPVDRRRVDYFTALGKVASAAHPSLESLRHLEEFAEPFDPVLTYFLHHELAAFYARSEASGSFAQLQHRLYTIYYSDPRDHSVRDVVDAMDLLIQEPRLASAEQRWDYLNAMLGFLQGRWANRGMGKPALPQVVLNDLERCIDAVESTLSLMDRLRSEVGVRESDWSARRAVVERELTRPLRSYRAELIPVYQKEAEKTASSQPTEPTPSAN